MAYNTGTSPTLAELITAKFIPQMFSLKVFDHTQSNLIVASRCNLEFRSILSKGSVVNIPFMSEIGATEVTPGTEPTPQDATGTPGSITINQWKESTIEVSDMSQIENMPDYLDKAAISISYAVLKAVDTEVGARFSALGGSTQANSDGDTMTDATILALMEYLDSGDVPDDGTRSFIGDPSMKVDMLGIDKFIRNDYVRQPVVATGQFGQIYNMSVFITNNLTASTTGNYGVMMHRDALGVVIQRNVRSQAVVQAWKFRTMLIADVIWGSNELRDTFGRSFYTRSS